MRPKIPERLEERIIEAKVELGYPSKTTYIISAIHKKLEEDGY